VPRPSYTLFHCLSITLHIQTTAHEFMSVLIWEADTALKCNIVTWIIVQLLYGHSTTLFKTAQHLHFFACMPIDTTSLHPTCFAAPMT
jgi:hypothetical protein